MFCVSGRIWGDYVLCFWTYLRRLCSVFLDVFEEIDFLCYCAYLRRLCSVLLHVSDETMFCVTARIWGDYVLCFWTYLRRLCSVLLHVSEETMFCVTARISKHMYNQFTIQTSLIELSKIHFLITYISYKYLILA